MLNLLHKDSATVSRETAVISRVALERILDNPYQYRRHYKEESLRELVININSLTWQLPATSGLQQPGMGRVVRRDDAGVATPIDPATYDNPGALVRLFDDPAIFVQLAYGHRRVRAFHILATGPKQFFPNTRGDWPKTEPTEFGTFPLQLAHLDDQAMAEFALTENSQREDVSAIEEAALLQRMIDELGLSIEDVGRKFGWGRSTVSNKLRLLRLPDRVQQLVLAGDLSEKHARGLLRIEAAPTILASLAEKCRAEMWPTRKLEDKITESIRMLKAMPDQTVTIPGQYGDVTVSPPWDLAWQPEGKDIRGACSGCPARITFGAERAPRCIDDTCYSAKSKAWPMEDFARQRAAARPVLDQLHGGDKLVDVMTDGGKRRVPILEQPVKDTWKIKDSLHIFNPNMTEEAVIIDNGICGSHCKCFAACFEEPSRYYYATDGYRSARWRPAPDVAPDVVYCCTDPACLAGHLKGAKGEAEQRRQAEQTERNAKLAADPVWAANQKRREEEEARQEQQKRERRAQAQQLVDSAVTAAGGVNDLWLNKGFLVDLVRLCGNEYYSRPDRQELDKKTVDELRTMLIHRVMMGQFSSGGQYDLTGVQTLANRIAPAKPQPGPGDSQKTDWQSGWDDDDEAAYQNLMGVWDGGSWNQMLSLETEQHVTQRTLLRLIESCPRKDVRGELWARYNNRKEAA